MTEQTRVVLKQALYLSPVERAELIEQLFASFDFPARDDVDSLWAIEVEERIDAHDQGKSE
ncbi:MAG: hypothetical protein MAG451_02052 [Anaerolineales bacterium]|nr:hypothetical protein [Anaerolineales bacterium]